MPERVQLCRVKGYRKPEGAIVVARPTRWGNPFPVSGDWIMWTAVALGYMGHAAGRRAAAVALHRAWITGQAVEPGPLAGSTTGGHIEFTDGTVSSFTEHVHGLAFAASRFCDAPTVGQPPSDLSELTGHDLACWCPLDQACHGDTLLFLANVDPENFDG